MKSEWFRAKSVKRWRRRRISKNHTGVWSAVLSNIMLCTNRISILGPVRYDALHCRNFDVATDNWKTHHSEPLHSFQLWLTPCFFLIKTKEMGHIVVSGDLDIMTSARTMALLFYIAPFARNISVSDLDRSKRWVLITFFVFSNTPYRIAVAIYSYIGRGKLVI